MIYLCISFVFPGTKLEINNNKQRKLKEWEKHWNFKLIASLLILSLRLTHGF